MTPSRTCSWSAGTPSCCDARRRSAPRAAAATLRSRHAPWLTGREDARVDAGPADQAVGRAADVAVGRRRVRVEQRLRRQHPAVEAVAALECLFVDERLLHRMRTSGRRKTFDRDDLSAGGA